MIPSPRVWRREGERGEYVVLHYGDTAIRVRRTLWREAPYEGYGIGDWVEVRPRGMTNEPHTGQVRDVHWDEHASVVRYWLTVADGAPLERSFEAHDLKPVEPPAPVARQVPGVPRAKGPLEGTDPMTDRKRRLAEALERKA